MEMSRYQALIVERSGAGRRRAGRSPRCGEHRAGRGEGQAEHGTEIHEEADVSSPPNANTARRSHETVDVSQEGRRVFVTLCRPEIHNAQNTALIRDLLEIVEQLQGRDDFDAVALRSSSEHWCTGLDMKEARIGWRPDLTDARRWEQVLAGLRSLDQVVVGLIDGYCLGGGVQLATGCDLRVATERAIFAIPAAREVGILAGMAGWYLPQLVGVARAKALLLGGAVLSATQAARWGLVDHVVRVGGLADAWEQIVAPLTQDTFASVGACKHIIDTALQTGFTTALNDYVDVQKRLLATPGCANRIDVTLEALAAGRRPYLEVGWMPADSTAPCVND
jgi:enoyl-CoA hydratase/carnithine racemase